MPEMTDEAFEVAVADILTLVHEALADAMAWLADRGVTGRTYFNAGEGLFSVWLERPGSDPGGGG